jgi:SAM-dependent methyltransferase
MKLSDLVNYMNLLESMSTVKDTAEQVHQDLSKITHVVSNSAIQLDKFSDLLAQRQTEVAVAMGRYELDLESLKQALRDLIAVTEKPWFAESYRLYEQEMCNDTAEYILDRRPTISKETEQFYNARLTRYNGWQHAAMIIRPGRESFIHQLLASDPLYLVDESHDLLQPAMDQFNNQYQQRLRPYTILERSGEAILGQLPKGQFGLVFAYNFFNFRPFEVLRQYLKEIYQKLHPGGVLVMTFNDCDRAKAVMLVEQHYCCYTPGYLVRELAQSLGYEISFSWTDQGPSTWLELRKPGERPSLRGGQALAKIIPKPIAKSK